MTVVCFLADPHPEVARLRCQIDREFHLEVLEAPLASTALTACYAPAALVVRANHEGAAPGALTTLFESDGPPVLALARPEDLDSVALYQWTDFAMWPWEPVEVVARLRRLTRGEGDAAVLRWGRLTLDNERHEAMAAGVLLDLTYTEFRLLELMMMMRGRVVTRERAYKDIWGSDHFGGLRTVDVHIRRLRSKLEAHNCPYVGTVRNVGYRLREIA